MYRFTNLLQEQAGNFIIKHEETPLDYMYDETYPEKIMQRYYIATTDKPIPWSGHEDPRWPGNEFEGCGNDDIGFMDFYEDPDAVYIVYLAVREAFRSQGLARRLMQHLYDQHPDDPIIHGQLAHDHSASLFNSFKQKYPERTFQFSK